LASAPPRIPVNKPPLSLSGQLTLLLACGLTVNRDEDVQGHLLVFQPPGSAFIIRA
jgi:hypothetical protein